MGSPSRVVSYGTLEVALNQRGEGGVLIGLRDRRGNPTTMLSARHRIETCVVERLQSNVTGLCFEDPKPAPGRIRNELFETQRGRTTWLNQ